MDETNYSISELAEAAGTTPRTIRYYTTEGLLPPPDTRGKYARYTGEHLLRLQLIARLKDAYLPLGEIRSQIEGLDTSQVQALLGRPAPPGRVVAESAAAYLTQVLANRPQALPTPASDAQRSAPPSPGANDGLAAYNQGIAVAGGLPVAGMLPPAQASEQPAPAPASVAPPREGLLSRLLPQRRTHIQPVAAMPGEAGGGAEQTAATDERWRRVNLAPGVELHLREPLPPTLAERVEQLVKAARALFDG